MSTQRHFTMSALNAAIAIRRYRNNHDGVTPTDAAISLQRLDADTAANDFASGLELCDILPDHLSFVDLLSDLRSSLTKLIYYHKPIWIRAFPYGRSRVAELLSVDEAQCLRSAGLFDDPPSRAIRDWWDEIAQSVRTQLADSLLAQGRVAEELSFQYEKKRLTELNIEREPIWVAIDNNGAGYDILSYDRGPNEPINRLIEVKSSSQDPPCMILTRGEWEAAVKFGSAYTFHLWALPNATLLECKVSDIAPHIPVDQGTGRWEKVEIMFPASASERD
jgi:hypothetical protein